MTDFNKADLLAYMRSHRLAVVASHGADGAPQAALVGIAVSPQAEIVFDTTTDSRKHGNLLRDARAAVVFSGPAERTLQLEGLARPLPAAGAEGQALRDIYYDAWPDGRQRLAWPSLAYWCIAPRWARYTDFEHGPLITEFDWSDTRTP